MTEATQTLPWFRQPRMAQGDFVVTWWVKVRNRRGASVLKPRSSSFTTLDAAREAAADRAYATKVEIRHCSEILECK